MPFEIKGKVKYFQFDSLFEKNILHAVFTRHGGVSSAPYNSLNLGSTVGDSLASVQANKEIALTSLGLTTDSVFDVWQVHGKEVVCTSKPRPISMPHIKADAILTDQPGIILLMRFADCVPILLYDPIRKVVGLAHAGWKGTVEQVAAETVKTMSEMYGSKPGNILAAIGPSIGPDHYEIGEDVQDKINKTFGQDASEMLHHRNGKESPSRLDLWRANEIVLTNAGVNHIETAGICTACHVEDWYSYRGEGGTTGRFGTIIALL